MLKSVLCITVVLVNAVVVATAQDDSGTEWVGGVGLLIGPGCNDAIEDAYPNHVVSGGYGWLDLELGLRLNATDQFSVTPNIDFLVNFVFGDESFVNMVILPALSARYALGAAPSVYLQGEVNYGIPNTGGDQIETDPGGIGFGATAGYTMKSGVDIELGYLHLPVESNGEDKNFGGALIRVCGTF